VWCIVTGVRRAILLIVAVLQAPQLSSTQSGPPYSPQQALATFRIADGFRIEVYAAEPLVSDPVAMEVDEYGRTYVVEMHGYPLDVSGTGRVVLLQDTNRDGRPDKSVVFADGLRLPTGIMRWKKGVIVTDPPDVLYFEDTNGDGKADIKRQVLTGFARTNPQHGMNTPVYGMDNWIYLANEGPVRTIRYHELFGDRGSEVHFTSQPDSPRLPADANGRSVRFRPDTRQLEMLSSRSQYGHTFDAWGHHFLNTNNRHLFEEVVAARYLSRNPAFAPPAVVEQLPDYRQPADVFPITRNPEFQLLTDVGVMTAASGVTCYLADLFPPAYRGATFVAEGAHNIVHVDAVREHGATFRASRMQEGREFLASTDAWFRPVSFYIGPDGALYVIDYYRKILEHPEWLDDRTAKSSDLYAGNDRGRIYRIVPEGSPAPSWADAVTLGDASAAELVQRLGDSNIWWRRQAQRLLIDRAPADVVPLLTRLAASADNPVGRVHALWTLEGLHELQPTVVDAALRDPTPGVRENAIQIAELHLSDMPALAASLLRMTSDANARVRFQLLLSLGNLRSPDAMTARNQLLFSNVEDEWMQVAALSAAGWDPVQLWQSAVKRLAEEDTPGGRALVAKIAGVAAAQKDAAAQHEILRSVLQGSVERWWTAPTLEGLASGPRTEKPRDPDSDLDRELLAARLFRDQDAPVRTAALQLLEMLGLPSGSSSAALLSTAEALVRDSGADPGKRADAVRVLGMSDAAPYEQLLTNVLTRPEAAPVQIAAVRVLAAIKGSHVAATFVDLWNRWTPAVRNEAVRGLVREPGRIPVLLDAVSSRKIKPTEIERPLRVRLMMVDDERQRDRARTLFAELTPIAGAAGARDEVVARYGAAATMNGDVERGHQVFTRVCSVCHQYRGEGGTAFGPDLGEVRNRLPGALLVDILEPNGSIADRYELWDVELTDGSTLAGVIGAETPASVTFRMPGGGQTTVPRARIASMRASDMSAMPEGLEAQIDVQQMADLIAFIRRM
jgi:putative membrane-bound dehydrogenase-like protein